MHVNHMGTRYCQIILKEIYWHSKGNIMEIGWSQKVTNEELYTKVQPKRNPLRKEMQWKLQLLRHIFGICDSWKIKLLDFGIANGNNKVGRPVWLVRNAWANFREFDDIEDWCCRAGLHELSCCAQDQQWTRSPRFMMMMMMMMVVVEEVACLTEAGVKLGGVYHWRRRTMSRERVRVLGITLINVRLTATKFGFYGMNLLSFCPRRPQHLFH